ncbi:MAG: type II toxin-antitoxin system RelE/ParE family toxin [Oscillospiraceae bacterium]|nr:type II toxin-antitoxin system RelE/ParE family toxin [Oscillospiraceae bacterium]
MPGRKYKIVFLPIAEEDLTGIVLYISHQLQNPSGAMNVFNRIRDAIIARSKAPESFQKYESTKDRVDTYYRINVGRSFSVFYVVKGNTMEVRRILYAARNFDSLLF